MPSTRPAAFSARRSVHPARRGARPPWRRRRRLSRRGVAVLILPVDVSKAEVADEPAFAVHRPTGIATERR